MRLNHKRTVRSACWLSLAAATLMALPSANAVEWYVNNLVGDDGRDGRSAEASGAGGPFRTIARALRAAGAGDRIILTKTTEPYRESITLQGGRHSGLPQSPFVFIGNGAILDGRREVPAGAWKFFAGEVFRFRPSRLAFQTLYIDDTVADRVAVDPKATQPPELEALQWCLWRGHVYFRTQPDKLPSGYTIYYGGSEVGLTMYEVRNVVVIGLTIRGFQLDGCNAHDGVKNALLADIKSEGNGRSGFSVGGASRIKLLNCEARKNGVAQIRAEGYAHCRLQDTRVESGPGVAILKQDQAVTEQVSQ